MGPARERGIARQDVAAAGSAVWGDTPDVGVLGGGGRRGPLKS